MTAFLVSLAISSVLMGVLLLSDRRVLELRRARTEVQTLDRQIAERRRENKGLRDAIDAANKHEFPAERVAREELHLVASDDVVLLYRRARWRPPPLGRPSPPSPRRAPLRKLMIRIRLATESDLPALARLIPASARELSRGYYSDAQTESAIANVFGTDSQLIADGTYFSRRSTSQASNGPGTAPSDFCRK